MVCKAEDALRPLPNSPGLCCLCSLRLEPVDSGGIAVPAVLASQSSTTGQVGPSLSAFARDAA